MEGRDGRIETTLTHEEGISDKILRLFRKTEAGRRISLMNRDAQYHD